MTTLRWAQFEHISNHPQASAWLQFQVNLGLADNTIEAYSRGLEHFLTFCERMAFPSCLAKREHIALYVRSLADSGLSNATMRQRLTAVRLFFDHLIEDGVRTDNPVGRGRYTPGKGFAGKRDRGLIPQYHKLPWIPSEDEWQAILTAARHESLRNRTMFAFAYDAGLRREELCSVTTQDIDPAHRLLHIRAENTKNRQERIVPYSACAGQLYQAYLRERMTLSRIRGPLFLSESARNRAQPISIWTWTKVVEGIAERAQVPTFTTHSLRHLCLTDLARAGWDIHEIAQFAGHRSVQSTLCYIHLSGRELAEKLARSVASLRAARLVDMEQWLDDE
jgi:site-specific recombinase XerD